jgi:subtilisin family serine protease
MRLTRSSFTASFAIALGACASPTVATAPVPAPSVAVAPGEAPLNWHLLDPSLDHFPGVSLLRAERELLRDKQPRRTVVVAVIDDGVDTSHAKLRAQLWTNAREIPGNGVDDDGNGYADDTHGWNLIGGRDGRNVDHDTFELTRLAAQCNRARDSVPPLYREKCPELQRDFARKRSEVEQTLANVRQFEMAFAQIIPTLKRATQTDSLTIARVRTIVPANDSVRQARDLYLRLTANGITPQDVADAKKAYTSQAQYGLNLSYDPRPIVGDAYPDTTMKRYGNRDVTGPEAEHGTHVAGIIGAARDAFSATGGIAQSVRLMLLRTVPDGDERDKDVAAAIRYAVDNGAQVINMSFGKGQSPYKSLVDAAVKYADSKGVLMVHAAGNEGADTGELPSFPTPTYLGGGRAANWIEVGATSWKGADSLVASFSNYGRALVDVFAPGFDIYSTVRGGGYKKESGTSMASPVVAGVAALLMSYYPTLTAADVKNVILKSATPMAETMVIRPGEGGARVRFGDLSATGGIVNVYSAVRMAEQMTAGRP